MDDSGMVPANRAISEPQSIGLATCIHTGRSLTKGPGGGPLKEGRLAAKVVLHVIKTCVTILTLDPFKNVRI